MAEDFEEEKFIKGSLSPVDIDVTKKILNQMEKSVCKIHLEKKMGTGFFTKIPYKQQYLTVLITNNHILGEKEIKNVKLLTITLNNEKRQHIIVIDEKKIKRKIYTNNKYDVTIIEIFEDIDGKYEYIELNDDIIKAMNLKKNEIIANYKNLYENESIYIVNYLKGENIVVSYGLLGLIKSEYEINHKCNTDKGSSGAPILSLKDNKLIGIHKGSKNNYEFNIGFLIIFPIIEFNQINFNNQDSKIYFNNDIINFNKIQDIKKPEINKLSQITIQYDIKKSYKIKLFGKKFIANNKKNCKILVDNREEDIVEFYTVNGNINRDIFEIKLRIINKITNMSYMFGDSINNSCKALISLPDICNLDTKDITNMSSLFIGCEKLSLLSDISQWNTESVTDMSSMFYYCKSLKSLPDISKWNTCNVTNICNMFSYCTSLSRLPNISSWYTKNVTNMCSLFNNCKELIKLPDISRWDTSNVKDMSFMFNNCINLVLFPDISKWKTSNLEDMSCISDECKVKPDTSKWDKRKIVMFDNDL